jgi:hypothetical protein
MIVIASSSSSSSLLPSVIALRSSAAAAAKMHPSDTLAASSSSKSVVHTTTSQLPLPTDLAPGMILSQLTNTQSAASSTSGFGSITNSLNSNSLEGRESSIIEDLNLPPEIIRLANTTITCRPLIPCIGTNKDDIIMAGISEQVFALKGNDMIFGALDDQIYGDKGNDIILSGGGNSLADGGSGDDVLTGGIGHTLLVGGSGNDKLFAGPGDTVMSGGSGVNHFECPQSIGGLARSIVLDYNPANGDTISGQCSLVNNAGSSDGRGGGGVGGNNDKPQTLPDTGDSSSPSSDASLGSEAIVASRG